jgi:hypothetical protein
MNVFLDILEILMLYLMDLARHVHATLEDLNKLTMEFQFVIKFRDRVSVNQMSLERAVTSVKLDIGILQVERVVRAVNVIQSVLIIHLATLIRVNASVSRE